MKAIYDKIVRQIKKRAPNWFLQAEGDKGIAEMGHRAYVGGQGDLWDVIGNLQFDFLLSKGLKPQHYLLDIACGSLRLGVKAIPYLDAGHYLGIEKETGLIQAGLEQELGAALQQEKQPNIVISDAFEFEKLAQKADYAIAQSLFTHLPPFLINLCFKNLLPWLQDDGVFYATYFVTDTRTSNPDTPHDHGYFAYTQAEMCDFGENNGFRAHYIGDWQHPRKQVIVEYSKR